MLDSKRVVGKSKGVTPYSEFFWSIFSGIRTVSLRISPYSVRMRENADQKNPEYGQFLGSVSVLSNIYLGFFLQK